MVHVYSMGGINIAIDGNCGSIHVLDRVAYELLAQFKNPFTCEQAVQKLQGKYPAESIREAWEEINSLVEKGILFSPEIEQAAVQNNMNIDKGLKALCLHVAHDCNLMCEYCFASKGSYKVAKKLMPLEIAFNAVDFLVSNSGKRKNVEIDFFGGEPMLNFTVVKKTVEYGREVGKLADKNINFTITTNGTLLDDDKINYINANMDNVVISLDGRKEVHDAIRYDAAGKGTYDRILADALNLVRSRNNKSYFIRGTFTSKNTDFSKDVLHLADLGFGEISMEPVVGKGEDFHIRREHIQEILNEYEQLAYAYIKNIKEGGKPFRFYHFNVDIYKGPCLYKRIAACGAGTEYLAVTPEGDFYPCHQFVGKHEFIIGNLDTGIKNDALCERFRKTSILTKEECRDCWAKLYCSGGCHANSYYASGDIMKPEELFCAMQKKRLECAIMIEAYQQLDE
ncbi:thioether cross-link-forming SCIFF peptide maturase [Pelotomaculum isophthalicicum JI]|uniref:Thioether cross-link-forming SCIFF peptide maturase n=1 Tax=Pelotomaculum isophthalicicum JI TaxID=947010 RepID=A0A9X4H3Q6_9FIRM|nr:thioether cross-link-forming SCIFF peptide maturase [Pelotomaculum isophthalicicum]MDF9409816.1 thioether cross-link-forming SCIFF peptide maturase [Pelotomaculum isophthalicicum JI]